jgi:DNA-binding response OmpR family regulator
MPSPVVLAIDDDVLMLKLERAFLERHGFKVLTATSGTDGLKLASLHPVDLVVLDYELGDLNGAVVATGIRRLRPKALVVVLSGADVPETVVRLVDAFLPKHEITTRLLPVLTMLGAAQSGTN